MFMEIIQPFLKMYSHSIQTIKCTIFWSGQFKECVLVSSDLNVFFKNDDTVCRIILNLRKCFKCDESFYLFTRFADIKTAVLLNYFVPHFLIKKAH